jgi:hypothetical protein
MKKPSYSIIRFVFVLAALPWAASPQGLPGTPGAPSNPGTPQPSSFTISGTIRTTSGQPLSGVTVSFAGGPSAVTGTSGTYSVSVAAGYSGSALSSYSGAVAV